MSITTLDHPPGASAAPTAPPPQWRLVSTRNDMSACPWCQMRPSLQCRRVPQGKRPIAAKRYRFACTYDICSVNPATHSFPTPEQAGRAWEQRP